MMASAQQAHVRAALAPQPIHDMMQIEMPPALRASVYLTLPTADRADALAQCAPVGRAQIEAAIPTADEGGATRAGTQPRYSCDRPCHHAVHSGNSRRGYCDGQQVVGGGEVRDCHWFMLSIMPIIETLGITIVGLRLLRVVHQRRFRVYCRVYLRRHPPRYRRKVADQFALGVVEGYAAVRGLWLALDD